MAKDNKYKDMMDEAFAAYYDLFRERGAVSEDTAVTMEELFGKKVSLADKQMVKKMASYCTVRKISGSKYWLDEERVANPGNIMRRKLFVVMAALLLVLVYCSIVGNMNY